MQARRLVPSNARSTMVCCGVRGRAAAAGHAGVERGVRAPARARVRARALASALGLARVWVRALVLV